MSITILFGIPNCDTVKKARRWLEKHHADFQFHDFRRDGLTEKQINSWLRNVELDVLLNKRSRTWRELSERDKTNVTKSKAIKLMVKQPGLVKRPVLVKGKEVIVGFDPKQYQSLFKK
jgi:arsenate reductase